MYFTCSFCDKFNYPPLPFIKVDVFSSSAFNYTPLHTIKNMYPPTWFLKVPKNMYPPTRFLKKSKTYIRITCTLFENIDYTPLHTIGFEHFGTQKRKFICILRARLVIISISHHYPSSKSMCSVPEHVITHHYPPSKTCTPPHDF